jgi:hypothetical protein
MPDRVTLRPAGDLRIRSGPVVIQMRHGTDIVIDGQAVDSASASGRILGHLGYLATSHLELSMEGAQNYLFASTEKSSDPFNEKYRVSDDRRSSITLGPGLRYATRELDIGATLFTNIGDPYSPAVSRFVVLRVSAMLNFGR